MADDHFRRSRRMAGCDLIMNEDGRYEPAGEAVEYKAAA